MRRGVKTHTNKQEPKRKEVLKSIKPTHNINIPRKKQSAQGGIHLYYSPAAIKNPSY